MPAVKTPVLPCTNGVTCPVPTASAPPSCCLDVPSARVYRRFPSRSDLLTSFLRRLPRTKHTTILKYITINRRYLFQLCLQANTFFFRIRSLLLGPKRAKSSKLDLTSYHTSSAWTVVPSFALVECCVLFLFLTTLHLLKPPLKLLLHSLAALFAFNYVPTLLQLTLPHLQLSALPQLVLLYYGIDPFNSREDSQTR